MFQTMLFAKEIRVNALVAANRAKLGHPGGDLSCADVLAVIFSKFFNSVSQQKQNTDRHRFVLSKGHAALAFYSALKLKGEISSTVFESFSELNSPLSGHPASNKLNAVETSTGPLGHGLPVGVGMALAGRLQNSDRKILVLCGDGEMQEGSNWEAAMLAGHHQLSNLVCIVDRNKLQHAKPTEDVVSLVKIGEMFEAFGWDWESIDGNDVQEITAVLETFSNKGFSRPLCIVANTIKGKGVSFMEGKAEWHHKTPSDDELQLAIEELSQSKIEMEIQ